jgi:hypothetical protein
MLFHFGGCAQASFKHSSVGVGAIYAFPSAACFSKLIFSKLICLLLAADIPVLPGSKDSGAKASSQPQGEPVPHLLTPCLAGPTIISVLAYIQARACWAWPSARANSSPEREGQKGYRSYSNPPNFACKSSDKREAERVQLILRAAQQPVQTEVGI